LLQGRKVVVVMPAYNAEQTIERTWSEVPHDIVDEVVVVDDHSSDATADVARRLGLTLFIHEKNRGYGGNQKTCYREALRRGADVVVMLHPDYQYPPCLIGPMAAMLASGMFDIVLGSRILGGAALKGGMPLYKYVSNRLLTFGQNLAIGAKLSEYHTGYRAYTRAALERLPLLENSDDFVFDNQVLAQAVYFGMRIGEISAPASYHAEASSISFRRSVRYGLGVLGTSARFVLERAGLRRSPIFNPAGRTLIE
jgi:glycosyltransferase involved in cell wall biosynthesis